MKKSREIAFLGIICALSVVFLLFGSIIGVLDITMAVASSLLLFIANEELGKKALMVYFATIIISLFFVTIGSVLSTIEYTIFAVYPLLKPQIEKAPRAISYLLKATYAVLASCGTVLIMYFFLPPLENGYMFFVYLATFVLVIVLFDFLLVRFRLYYHYKLRYQLKIDKFFK